jgi:predicted dehydrogenase
VSALRILLVGLGARGAFWAEVINRSPDCELIGYVDPSPEALKRARERFGDRPTFVDLDEALAAVEGVEALVLATPPEGRERQIRAACELKLPLLVEKPLALSLEEAATYVRLAEEASVPLMVGLNFRYLAVTEETVRLLQRGVVGRPEFARFTYERWRDGYRPRLNKYPLTMVHPMLWEQSIHHFDLMRFVYEAEPEWAYCKTWNPSWSMYDDDTNVSAIFTFTDNLVVNYQGTWQSGWQEPHFEWRTDCTEGILTQGDQFGELSHAQLHDSALTPVPLPPHEQWVTDTSGVLRAFVSNLVGGQPLECSGRDHLKSLAMVEACIVSSESGRAVDVQAILERLSGSH